MAVTREEVDPYEMIEKKAKSDPNYSTIAMGTMNSENIYEVPATSNTGSEIKIGEDVKKEDIKRSKKLIFLVAMLVSVVMLVVIVGCFVALFLEVAKLQSEASSFKKTLTEQIPIIMRHLQQINVSVEERYEYFTDIQDSKVQQLNASVRSSFEDFTDIQDSKVQQLNALVQRSFEDFTDIQDSKVQQLNVSVRSSFTDIQNSKVQQLNKSIISRIEDKIEEIVANQNSKVQQLNTLIISSINGIGNLLNSTVQQLNTSVNQNTDQLGIAFRAFHSFHPASCASLPPSSPSGYYLVGASISSAVRVYCDMTRSCGEVTGGWRRVAELDMTNSSHQCPSSLQQRNDSNKRTCGMPSNSNGCFSVTFSTATLEYSKVCGKITAYQYGVPDAFVSARADGTGVDGVSLTHNPREHIWTFVAAYDETGNFPPNICPCTNANTASRASQPPAFVGNDYFCDTGSSGIALRGIFYGDDPLWDGAGCGPLNTCCSFNNPPWFYKQLLQPTTSDIDMAACRTGNDEDIAIETVEIYVQ